MPISIIMYTYAYTSFIYLHHKAGGDNSTLKIISPNVGLEPTTLRLRVSCSTD